MQAGNEDASKGSWQSLEGCEIDVSSVVDVTRAGAVAGLRVSRGLKAYECMDKWIV
jgi:hypothetical protein